MTILTIPRASLLVLLVAGLFSNASLQAQESPHWSKSGCQACHEEAAPVDGVVNLKASDSEALCGTCHGDRGDAKPCRHGSGLGVGEVSIPGAFSPFLKDGEVVCSTCHDVVYQCKHSRIQYSYQNKGFLRDRDSRRTGKYCVKCHEASQYQKLNPHEGVAGTPPKASCMLCHKNIPESGEAGEIEMAFNMQHDLNDTCLGCHNVGPHPRNLFSNEAQNEWIHLVAPSARVTEKMKEAEADGIVLPLNAETGEIFCSTCHNQHGFMPGSAEQQPKHRLRVNDVCQVCHDK